MSAIWPTGVAIPACFLLLHRGKTLVFEHQQSEDSVLKPLAKLSLHGDQLLRSPSCLQSTSARQGLTQPSHRPSPFSSVFPVLIAASFPQVHQQPELHSHLTPVLMSSNHYSDISQGLTNTALCLQKSYTTEMPLFINTHTVSCR